MSKAVERFIKRLKDYKEGKQNFEIKEYKPEKYDCEIAQITKSLQERNADNIAKILKSKISQDYFEIKHPFKNNITLRAVANINICDIHPCNAIFFIDKENKNLICIIQWFVFIHYFITETEVYVCSKSWGSVIGDSVALLARAFAKGVIIQSNIYFQDKKWAWTLRHNRPAHYFGHIFPNYYAYLLARKTDDKQVFYAPKNANFIQNEDKDYVYLYPFTHYSQKSNESFSQMVTEVLQDFNSLVAPQDKLDKFDKEQISESEIEKLISYNTKSLTLWLGIPGERRVWLEQWEGIPLILKNLSRYFPSIKVYVDGMTAYDGERIEVANNLEAFWKIVQNTKEVFEVGDSRHCEQSEAIHNQAYFKDSIAESRADKIMDCHADKSARNDNPCASLRGASETSNEAIHNTESRPQDSQNSATILGIKGEKITLKSLSGYDYRTKICYCAMCDIAISEISTTALTPFNFCQKGGVGFYSAINEYQVKDYRQKGRYFINTQYLITIRKGSANADFHIPPEHIYNLAAESLEELSKEGKLTNFSKDNPLKMHRLNVPPVELYAKKHALEQKTKIKVSNNPSTKRLLKEISYQKQLLEIESLELDIQLKQLQIKSKEVIPPLPAPKIQQGSAKDRIHSHLAYKLGKALILNSKSLLGYIRMPYVLSYIKESHRKEILDYETRVAKNPALKLPKLESYPDYKEALKEKECLTYKLGEALMQADKNWLKGGYLRFYFLEVPRLKREFREKKK